VVGDQRHDVADGADLLQALLVDLLARQLLQLDDEVDGVDAGQSRSSNQDSG
jgi:hypothetical protein